MRGEIIFKILEMLEDGVNNQIDITNAILRAGFGASGGKIDREYKKLHEARLDQKLERVKILKLQKYLSKLKHDKLIQENSSKKIFLSEKGRKKLKNFQNSVSPTKYMKKMGGKVIVISYDIPVAFNRERNTLRNILRTLGFSLIHKSVWVGKALLPERFISDLGKLGILDYVEILEVTKDGTLKSRN